MKFHKIVSVILINLFFISFAFAETTGKQTSINQQWVVSARDDLEIYNIRHMATDENNNIYILGDAVSMTQAMYAIGPDKTILWKKEFGTSDYLQIVLNRQIKWIYIYNSDQKNITVLDYSGNEIFSKSLAKPMFNAVLGVHHNLLFTHYRYLHDEYNFYNQLGEYLYTIKLPSSGVVGYDFDDNDNFYVAGEDSSDYYISAYNKQGKLLWKKLFPGKTTYQFDAPNIIDDIIYCSIETYDKSNPFILEALDLNGNVLWQIHTTSATSLINGKINDTVFTNAYKLIKSEGESHRFALAVDTGGTIKWETQINDYDLKAYPAILDSGNVVYTHLNTSDNYSNDIITEIINAKSGKIINTIHLYGRQLMFTTDKKMIYTLNTDGRNLTAFRIKN